MDEVGGVGKVGKVGGVGKVGEVGRSDAVEKFQACAAIQKVRRRSHLKSQTKGFKEWSIAELNVTKQLTLLPAAQDALNLACLLLAC